MSDLRYKILDLKRGESEILDLGRRVGIGDLKRISDLRY